MLNAFETGLAQRNNVSFQERFAQLKQDLLDINAVIIEGDKVHFDAVINSFITMNRFTSLQHDPALFNKEFDLITAGWIGAAYHFRLLEDRKLSSPSKWIDLPTIPNVSSEDKWLFATLETGIRVWNNEINFEDQSHWNHGFLSDYLSDTGPGTQEGNVKKLVDTIHAQRIPSQFGPQQFPTEIYKESLILANLPFNTAASVRCKLNAALNIIINSVPVPHIGVIRCSLKELKLELLKLARESSNIDSMNKLATHILNLVDKIGERNITQADIDHFVKETNPYRASFALDTKLNHFIYAVVAIVTIICVASAAAASAGALGTVAVAGAALGLGIGAARYTIWQTNKKVMDKIDTLVQQAESRINRPL